MSLTRLERPRSSAHCIATMAVGGASLICLVVHQVFFKKDGLFHHDLFQWYAVVPILYEDRGNTSLTSPAAAISASRLSVTFEHRTLIRSP